MGVLDVLARNVWAALAVWALVYAADYVLTIVGARLYGSRAAAHQELEKGYELNPYFHTDVAHLRWVSPRLLLLVGAVCVVILMGYGLTKDPSDTGFRLFALGLLLGPELSIHVRHAGNILGFSYRKNGEAMRGHVKLRHWLSLRVSAAELLAFGALWALLSFVGSRWFFWGGAVGCLGLAVSHWRHSSRELMQARTQGWRG